MTIHVTAAALGGGDKRNPCWGRCQHLPWEAFAAARHPVLSGLAPRQPKQPEQMKNNHQAPMELIAR